MTKILFAFLDKEVDVHMLSDKVAYSWDCGCKSEEHTHTIDCLLVWHNCDLNLDPVDDHWTAIYTGWKPSGVGLHTLISIYPLHIEASVYWPSCCGMHGWIREGKWVSV